MLEVDVNDQIDVNATRFDPTRRGGFGFETKAAGTKGVATDGKEAANDGKEAATNDNLCHPRVHF